MSTVVIAVPPAHRGEGSFEKLYRRAREVSGDQARPLGGNRLRVPVGDAEAILSAFGPTDEPAAADEPRATALDVDDLPDGTRKAHQPTGAGGQVERPTAEAAPSDDAPDVDDLPDGQRAAHTPTGAAGQPERPGNHPTPTRARRGPRQQEG